MELNVWEEGSECFLVTKGKTWAIVPILSMFLQVYSPFPSNYSMFQIGSWIIKSLCIASFIRLKHNTNVASNTNQFLGSGLVYKLNRVINVLTCGYCVNIGWQAFFFMEVAKTGSIEYGITGDPLAQCLENATCRLPKKWSWSFRHLSPGVIEITSKFSLLSYMRMCNFPLVQESFRWFSTPHDQESWPD